MESDEQGTGSIFSVQMSLARVTLGSFMSFMTEQGGTLNLN